MKKYRRYVRAFSTSKKDIAANLDTKAETLVEHLIKYYCFPDNQARNHWVEEIRASLSSIHKFKSNNKFPSSDFIFKSLWDNGMKSGFPRAYQDMCEQYGEPTLSMKETEECVVNYLDWVSDILSKYGRVLRSEVENFLENYNK